MPILLSDAIAQLPEWTLGPFKAKDGQMQIATIRGKEGGWPAIQLLPMDHMGEVTTPFAPSVYRGTGNEPRKGIIFQVPDAVVLALCKIEDWAQKQHPGGVWHSAIKTGGTYPACIKAKINVSGPNACRILDAQQRPTEWPESWPRLAVHPHIGGAWRIQSENREWPHLGGDAPDGRRDASRGFGVPLTCLTLGRAHRKNGDRRVPAASPPVGD